MEETQLRRYEITIPQTTLGQLRDSKFHWTFTIHENLVDEYRAQYSSMETYKKFNEIRVDDVMYECIIFDFIQGKLIIETKEKDKHKVLKILNFFTINISSTNRTYFINSKKIDGVL